MTRTAYSQIHRQIQRIWYFTAWIDGSHRQNQEAYLQALDTLPLVEIVLGKYKYKTLPLNLLARCQFPNPVRGGAAGQIHEPATW